MNNLFRYVIQGKKIFFKHARGTSDRSGKEFHIYHEIILFLDGEGEFISENLHTRVKPETLIVIPKESYHQMVIHGDQDRYYRCVLQFDDMEEIGAMPGDGLRTVWITEADQEIQYLFKKMMDAAKTKSPCAQQILKASFVLLMDIIQQKKEALNKGQPQNEIVRLAVDYINRNLGNVLTVQQIAQVCNTSPSSLAHIFKREMYCSVYKFITKKRLICAYQRITAGEAATVVSVECGFPDYSGFYKQYKKAFGFPPSRKTEPK